MNDSSDKSSFDKLEKFKKTIEEETFEFKGTEIKITVTIGVAKYPSGTSLEKWVELADKKMYAGKNSGKNTVVI